jgi:hypothetical protein
LYFFECSRPQVSFYFVHRFSPSFLICPSLFSLLPQMSTGAAGDQGRSLPLRQPADLLR